MYHMQKISICLYTDLEDKKPCLWIVNSIATILIRLKLQSKKKKSVKTRVDNSLSSFDREHKKPVASVK